MHPPNPPSPLFLYHLCNFCSGLIVMSAPLPLLKMDKRSEPTMNHTSWRCIFKISAESGGVHGSGHWVSSSALPGVSIVIIIININHHHIIWIIFPWLYLNLNLNLFNVEAMFGSCCWSKCLLCFRKAFYILYILKEEEDFEFSGLSYLTKTVNFKQECLDECYKRFLRDITSQIGVIAVITIEAGQFQRWLQFLDFQHRVQFVFYEARKGVFRCKSWVMLLKSGWFSTLILTMLREACKTNFW